MTNVTSWTEHDLGSKPQTSIFERTRDQFFDLFQGSNNAQTSPVVLNFEHSHTQSHQNHKRGNIFWRMMPSTLTFWQVKTAQQNRPFLTTEFILLKPDFRPRFLTQTHFDLKVSSNQLTFLRGAKGYRTAIEQLVSSTIDFSIQGSLESIVMEHNALRHSEVNRFEGTLKAINCPKTDLALVIFFKRGQSAPQTQSSLQDTVGNCSLRDHHVTLGGEELQKSKASHSAIWIF